MVTMLLVEDESFERASLRSCIDWELAGVQIVDEAGNGAQGLAKVLELHPDIVLTDVKMPVMDGIEMSRKIRNVAPATKIVFISSYDDFEYARQAIDLRATAYITKPVNEGELLKIVKRAADEISEKALEQKLESKIRSNYTVSLNLARQAAVNRAVTGLPLNAEEAGNLGLAWLCGAIEHLCVILGMFRKEMTEAVDSRLAALNRQTVRVCGNSVSSCVNAGVMLTIAAYDGEADEAAVQPLKDALTGFFREAGCGEAKLECACGNGADAKPAELYLRILQNNLSFIGTSAAGAADKKNKQQIVEEVLHIVHTQYASDLTIESIARAMHFTPNYLGSVFKTVMKTGINRYINNYRLERAREMLMDRDVQVTDVAQRCGYDNITYFYTVFKKECGVTPNEYRQQAAGV
jgi:two-component system response regulator YesN